MAIASRQSMSRPVMWLVLLLVLLTAFGLRAWRLDEPSMWHDEAWSLRPLYDPLAPSDESLPDRDDGWAVFAYVEALDYHYGNNTPPLSYALQYPLGRTAGDSLFALRYFGVLVDLLTIAVAAQLLRRWEGWNAALLGAVLLSVSPLLWAYAREFRPYMAVPLLVLILLWQVDLLLRVERRFPWRLWGTLLLVELTLLYTHNLSVPTVGWLNVIVYGVWLWRKQWRWLAIWSAGQAALLVVFLPWMGGQSPSGTTLNTLPDFSLRSAWNIWQGYLAPLPWMVGQEDVLIAGSVLLGGLVLLSTLVVLWRNRTQHTLLVLSQMVLLPVFSTMFLRGASIDFHPRYYILSVAPTLILLASGVASLPPLPTVRRVATVGVLLSMVVIGLVGIDLLLNAPEYQHDDFRAIAEYYATLPDDVLVIIPYSWEPTLDEYYVEKLDIRTDFLNLDLYGDPDLAIQTINAALAERTFPVTIEYMNWYQLPADLRGMYPCVFEAAGQRLGEVVVQGISTTAYEIERPLVLVAIDATAQYGVVDLTGAAQFGERSICVQTNWTLQRETDDDWRVSARLLTADPPGWELLRTDTDIRNDIQEPTSGWVSGDQGAAYSLLRLPDGAPPGEYKVQIVVFSADHVSGLDRLADGVSSGRVLPLGAMDVAGALDISVLDVPQAVNVPVAEGVILIGHDAHDQMLNAGAELRITLYWSAEDTGVVPWSGAELALRGDGWHVTQPVAVYTPYSLDWHGLRVPADASGTAVLTLQAPDVAPVTLATYSIEQADRLFASPAFDVPVQTVFNTLAVLEGFSVGQTVISTDQRLDLTLVWRVLDTPDASYRVFTHLLNVDGQVIAQHDGYPVNGDRPTIGWVPDEYIVDPYALEFLPEFADYRGPARLEVGFYDPDTGVRVPVTNGANYSMLPIDITVQ